MKTHLIPIALLLLACGCDGDSNPNISRARVGIKQLNDTIVNVRSTTGNWPEDLRSLTQPRPDGGEPYLAEHALTDPWGRKYGYDPATLDPNTAIPLIWSEGPNPRQTGSKITNWETKEDGSL